MGRAPKSPTSSRSNLVYGALMLIGVALTLFFFWRLDALLKPATGPVTEQPRNEPLAKPVAPPVAPSAPPTIARVAAAPSVTAHPPAAIERSPYDQPAPVANGFDPNAAFPDEGPMRVMDIEKQNPRDPKANIPSEKEWLSLHDETIARLKKQIADLEAAGKDDEAAPIKVRLKRLESQRDDVLAGKGLPKY